MKYYEFRAMNTDILLGAEGIQDKVEAGFHKTQDFIEAAERRFTRFSEDSELSALNRSAGSWFEASPEMYDVITQALRLHIFTRGLFDPSVLDALERVGYDRTLDEIRLHGAVMTALPGRPRTHRFSDLRLDPDGQRICLPEDLRIDLGGIAKGWIAEQAAHVLAEYSRACAVDAGGDAFFIGRPEKSEFWRVTLEDPCDARCGLAVLKLGPGAVATSAVTRRRWQQGGQERHHLIDPRTQEPAETDLHSVTVIAAHAVEAEVYAKSLLIGGSGEVRRIGGSFEQAEFIVVDQNNHLWGSKHSREILDV